MPRTVHPAFYEQITGYLFGIGVQPHNLKEARAIIQGIDLAAWAERAEIQQAFPDIHATVTGATKTDQIVGLQLTDKG